MSLLQAVRAAFEEARIIDRFSIPSDESYDLTLNAYFSNQERCLKPLGIVRPKSADEVSKIIATVNHMRKSGTALQIAVKSGGHCVWPGAANIDGGITIDLTDMNRVTIKDGDEVDIGAGAVWGDVYQTLIKLNITVPGGRVADVGVGGLTLGGGISYFSPRVGFVCDNVVAYEIVLADSSILHVSRESHPDLWWALKGGGSNFGIVTSFIIRTFPCGDIFGGCFVYPMEKVSQHLEAYHQFASVEGDKNALAITVYSFREGQGRHIFNGLTYTEPESEPQPLASLRAISKPLYETPRVTSQYDLTYEQTKLSTENAQNCYMTTTIEADLAMLHEIISIWEQTIPGVEAVPGICWAISFQLLHPATMRESEIRGGNCMGLQTDAPPLLIVLLTNFWTNASDNDRLIEKSRALVDNIDTRAKELGVHHPFKYMNYAWKDQDVFSGYGASNKSRLQKIASKYDPDGFFQTVMPGGFKLF